jgi:hypothetical protein
MLRDEMSRTTFEQLVEEGRAIEANLTAINASNAPKPASVTTNILLPLEIAA